MDGAEGSERMPPISLPPLSSRRQVLGAGLTAAFGTWAALGLFDGDRASASTSSRSAQRVSVVGDSLTLGTLPYQGDAFTNAGWSGSAIDAFKSRGIRTKMRIDQHTGLTAVDAIRKKWGDSDLWVVALGTNDAGIFAKDKQPEAIRQMMDRIGSGHYVLWINVYLPATPRRQQNWNTALATVAAERKDEMFVFDWASLAAQNPKWLAHDQIHCSPQGYRNRSTAIAFATKSVVPSTPPPPVRSGGPWMKTLPS
jgi:lysophospholipase L1-like esterase